MTKTIFHQQLSLQDGVTCYACEHSERTHSVQHIHALRSSSPVSSMYDHMLEHCVLFGGLLEKVFSADRVSQCSDFS